MLLLYRDILRMVSNKYKVWIFVPLDRKLMWLCWERQVFCESFQHVSDSTAFKGLQKTSDAWWWESAWIIILWCLKIGHIPFASSTELIDFRGDLWLCHNDWRSTVRLTVTATATTSPNSAEHLVVHSTVWKYSLALSYSYIRMNEHLVTYCEALMRRCIDLIFRQANSPYLKRPSACVQVLQATNGVW